MVICTDMDGVWSDYNYGLSLLGHEEGYLEHVFSNKDIDSWDWVKECFSTPQLNKLMAKINESCKFWEDLPPVSMEFGTRTLKSLLLKGHQFHVLTARPGNKQNVKKQTRAWFKHYTDLDIPEKHITICERDEKMKFLDLLKADIFIDDCPDTIIEMNRRTENMFAIEHKYNLHLKNDCARVKFVKNTREFFMEVRGLTT